MKIMERLEEGATAKAVRNFAKILAVIIVLSVAAFADVCYIVMMSKLFSKDPTLLLFCYLGAFTSFLAIGYLLLGKTTVFAPGAQILASWIVFALELVIIALNIILVFNPHPTGFLQAWAFMSPATPVLHMIGVALIYFLDPELKEKHKDMEMQSKLRKSERDLEKKEKEYQIAMEEAKIQIRTKQLEFTIRELENAINSAESQQRIAQHASDMNSRLLTEMSGRNDPKNDDDDDNGDYYNANRFGRK